MAKKKMITREGTLDGVVADALSEMQNLRDEISDWRDNMSSNDMEHLPKYDEVSECVDELDQFCDEEPEMPEESGAKRSTSRAARLDHAVSDIQEVIDHIQTFLDSQEEENTDWAESRDALQDIVDNAQSVSFPGMFG